MYLEKPISTIENGKSVPATADIKKNYKIRNCRVSLALPDGRLFLRKTICDLTQCQACYEFRFLECLDPTGKAGPWIEVGKKVLQGQCRLTSSSRKKKKPDVNRGPEFMVSSVVIL